MMFFVFLLGSMFGAMVGITVLALMQASAQG